MEARGVALGIGPVALPDYLDRPEIVTRSSGNELSLADFDQWAGRLEDNFTRVLAENLSSILETDRVSLYPWKSSTPVDFQVTVEVSRFERAANGAILPLRLNAWRWQNKMWIGAGVETCAPPTSTASQAPDCSSRMPW